MRHGASIGIGFPLVKKNLWEFMASPQRLIENTA
jgi:hypothetical protein